MEENKVIYDPKQQNVQKKKDQNESLKIFSKLASIIKDVVGKLKKKKKHHYVIKNFNFPIKIDNTLCGTSEIKIFEEQTLKNELEKNK